MNNTLRQIQIIGGVVSSGVAGATGQFVYNYEPETKIIETKQEDIIETTFDSTGTTITGEAINPTIVEYVPPLTNFITGNEIKPIVEEIKILEENYLDGQETVAPIKPISFEIPTIELRITMPPAIEEKEIIEAQTPILMTTNTSMPEIKGESSIKDILIEEDTIEPTITESNIIDLNYFSKPDENSIDFAISQDTVIESIATFMQPISIEEENIIEFTTESNPIIVSWNSQEDILKKLHADLSKNKFDVSGWFLKNSNGLFIENEEWVETFSGDVGLAITFTNYEGEKANWLITHSNNIDWSKVNDLNNIFEKYGISEAE